MQLGQELANFLAPLIMAFQRSKYFPIILFSNPMHLSFHLAPARTSSLDFPATSGLQDVKESSQLNYLNQSYLLIRYFYFSIIC